MLDNCSEQDKVNLGLSKCDKLPQLFRTMITTPKNFVIPAATVALGTAAIKTFLQNAAKANKSIRIYFWPKFVGFESANEETVYEETALADLLVRDGKYRFRFHIKKNLCLHKAMFSHRGSGDRVFLFDIENQMFGTELSNGDFAGFNLSLLNTEKLMISDGSVSTKSPVYIVLEDSKEIDKGGALIDGSFISELVPLTDVVLEVVDADASGITVSVKQKCDGTPVSGLVVADFAVTTTAGAAQSTDSVTETEDGVYVLDPATTYANGFVNLVSAATLSIEAYESTGKATVTI